MANDPLQNPYPIRPAKKKKGPDSAPFGLLVGLLFPLIAVFILFFFWSGNTTFSNYLKMFVQFNSPSLMNTSSKVLSLSVITNLIPFFFFLNRKQYATVKGLLISMVLFFVLMLLYKVVWQ